MKEINIDRVYPLNRHYSIKILHDLNPLKSFTLSNASLDLHLSRSLISQLCLNNSDCYESHFMRAIQPETIFVPIPKNLEVLFVIIV